MAATRNRKSLIEKEYFTLEEVVEEHGLPWRDVTYLAENGHLRLSVLVYSVPVSAAAGGREGCVDRSLGEEDAHLLTGLADLSEQDAHLILKNGRAEVRVFRLAENEHWAVLEGSSGLAFKRADLLMRKAERVRLEEVLRLEPPAGPVPTFSHSEDYREVCINGQTFMLGSRQAMVVKRLHAAALEGSPWQNGKTLLYDADSLSTRMHDLFKSKGADWRRLIVSNGRGLYRLAICDPANSPRQPHKR